MCMIASLQQQGEMGVGRAGTDVKSPKIKASVACTTAGYDAVGGGRLVSFYNLLNVSTDACRLHATTRVLAGLRS